MKRVAFAMVHTPTGWTGGINYISNLLHAIDATTDRLIEPVLIVPSDTPPSTLQGFPPLEVIRTPLIGPSRTLKLLTKCLERWADRNVLLDRLLERNRISLLSHSVALGASAVVPTLGWLPDFQHRRMPEFFSPKEWTARDHMFRSIADQSASIVLSSFDAQSDLANFAPDAVAKSEVLHFVSGFAGIDAAATVEELRSARAVESTYFHLPNQFWAHKNHRIVVDALAVMRSRGQPVQVVATGHTHDPRRPTAFADLMRHAEARGVSADFRVLGLVSQRELMGLMEHAVAIVNPSFFEGWSTSVEEAKSLGKRILLSDIPVHREQAPRRAYYFPADDPDQLADAMQAALLDHSDDAEVEHRALAKAGLGQRFAEFGRQYQQIALRATMAS